MIDTTKTWKNHLPEEEGSASRLTKRGTQRGIWRSVPGTGLQRTLRRQNLPLGRDKAPTTCSGGSIIATPTETAPSLVQDFDRRGCLPGHLDLLLGNCRQRPRSAWGVLLCATLNATALHTRPRRLRTRRLPSATAKHLAAGMAGSPSCLRAAPLFTFGEKEVRVLIGNLPYVRDARCRMETPPADSRGAQ